MSEFTVSEIEAVRELNDYLDDPQGDDSNVPEAGHLIAAAWWATEDFIRTETGKCSSTATLKTEHAPQVGAPFTCQCCRYFYQIRVRATALIRHAV